MYLSGLPVWNEGGINGKYLGDTKVLTLGSLHPDGFGFSIVGYMDPFLNQPPQPV